MSESPVVVKTPHPYQREAINNFEVWYAGGDAEALIALTVGMGKTFTASCCVKWVLDGAPERTVLWITHRDEILKSTVIELQDNIGVPCEVEKANRRAANGTRIVVASVQSLHKKRLSKLAEWLSPALIVFDEAHHALAATWMAIKQAFPHTKVLNLTATPYRQDVADELDLGRVLIKKSTSDGIRLGVLVPPRPVSTLKVSLKKVKVTLGDFATGSLAALLSREDILAKSCDNVLKHIPGRRGIAFSASVDHGKLLTAGLRERGLRVEEVYGDTPTEAREVYYAKLKMKEIDLIVSFGVLTEGFNLPEVDLVAIFRPTKSASLFLQMLGRGLRACKWTGKKDCLVIDVADTAKQKTGGDAVILPTEEDQKKFSARRNHRSPEALVFLSWFFRTDDVLRSSVGATESAPSDWHRLRSAQILYDEVFKTDPAHRPRNAADSMRILRYLYSRKWVPGEEDPDGYRALLSTFRCTNVDAFVLMMKHAGWRYCPHENIVAGGGVNCDAGGPAPEGADVAVSLSAMFQDDPALKNFVTDIFETSNLATQASNCYETFEIAGRKTFWFVIPDETIKAHFVCTKDFVILRRFDGVFLLWTVQRMTELDVIEEGQVMELLPSYAMNVAWAEQLMTEKQAEFVRKILELTPAQMKKTTVSRLSASAIISTHRNLPLLRKIAPQVEAAVGRAVGEDALMSV